MYCIFFWVLFPRNVTQLNVAHDPGPLRIQSPLLVLTEFIWPDLWFTPFLSKRTTPRERITKCLTKPSEIIINNTQGFQVRLCNWHLSHCVGHVALLLPTPGTCHRSLLFQTAVVNLCPPSTHTHTAGRKGTAQS